MVEDPVGQGGGVGGGQEGGFAGGDGEYGRSGAQCRLPSGRTGGAENSGGDSAVPDPARGAARERQGQDEDGAQEQGRGHRGGVAEEDGRGVGRGRRGWQERSAGTQQRA